MPDTAPVPAAEWRVDARIARRLLRSQHPDLADLPLRRLGAGWDAVVYRLGRDLTVRLPRRELGARLLANELTWVPRLPLLPLAVPEPVRAGHPEPDFPAPWSVCRHVPGHPVGPGIPEGPLADRAAMQLVAFLSALAVPPPPGAPVSTVRGTALAARDTALRASLGSVPAAQRAGALEAWERGLAASPYDGPRCWVHGDLHGLNVLVGRGGVTGIIDFGDLCAGDPSGDLACAWLLLGPRARAVLRAELGAEPDVWDRGRAWATYLSVMFLAHAVDDERNATVGARGMSQVIGD